MYSFFPCNEFHQVKSNMYVSALVCTSIYWYGQVHTSQELVCTGTDQYKPVHTGMYLHKRIYDIITTGIYWYSPTESVMYLFKKNVSKTRTRDFPHTVRRISPCTTGVYTLTLECRPFLFLSIYRYLHYLCTSCLMLYRRRRSGSSMLGTQHVAV